MSNGVTFPPDQQPVADPVTGRIHYICTCTIDGKVWNRGIGEPPPCTHTEAEMDAFFNTQPPGPEQRQRWKVTTPPTPVTAEAGERRIIGTRPQA